MGAHEDAVDASDIAEPVGSPASAPPPTPSDFRPSGGFGALALLVAVALVAASVVGYAVGRRGSTRTSTSNGSASAGVPSANNGDNASSTNGSQFGGFGSASGNGSPSFGASSSGSGATGTTASANAQHVASQVDPAIVDVTSTLPNGVAKGTGMVVTSDGEILTNDHVISGATSIQVQFVTTGKSYSASLVGYDAQQDVALLKIANVSGLTTIAPGSSNVSNGQSIVVIGNANGQDGTPAVVDGTVTATNRAITASDEIGYEAERLSGLIELSANVVAGDSGGAVADSNGRVIAMTTAAWAGNGAVSFGAGDAYAIPIDTALSVVHEIEAGQASATVHLGEHGLLGVGVQDVNGSRGAYVAEVQTGSAAEHAGLVQGDTITAVNGTTITSSNALNAAMAATHVGDHVELQWQDAGGSSHRATVTLTDGVA